MTGVVKLSEEDARAARDDLRTALEHAADLFVYIGEVHGFDERTVNHSIEIMATLRRTQRALAEPLVSKFGIVTPPTP